MCAVCVSFYVYECVMCVCALEWVHACIHMYVMYTCMCTCVQIIFDVSYCCVYMCVQSFLTCPSSVCVCADPL